MKKFLLKNAEALLSMVDLIAASGTALEELLEVRGRASIEAVLRLSAMAVAGEKRQGRKGGPVGRPGSQYCAISLSDRKLRVGKSRLRRNGRGEGGEGVVRRCELRKQSEWLGAHYSDVARSMLEGLEEMFTINRLDLSPSLRRCLGTTNHMESPHLGVRMRTRRVSRRQDGP